MNRSFTTVILIVCLFLSIDAQAQCGLTVDAGEDQVACEMGGDVILNGNINGPYEDFFWSPPDNLSSTTTLNPTATVNGPFTYTLTATATSTTNLIVNGDFESGNTSFTTGYAPFDFNLPTEGEYIITDNPASVIPPLANCVDHTSGAGNMMVADGATTPNTPIWCQTVTVNPNTDYEFGAWFLSHFINPPTIQFTFNGIPGSGTYSVPPQLCDWSEYTEIWNSGGNTSVNVCIQSISTAAIGNDIAIDDIYMYEICEVTDEVDVMVTDVNAEVADPMVISCDNPQVTLDGSGSTIGPGYTFLWTTFDGFIAGSSTSFITQAGAAGTYTLTVTDVAGCTDEFEVIVDGSNLPPDLNVTGGMISCNQPEINLSAFSSVPNVTYTWSGPNGYNSNEQEPLISEPGLYSVTVTAPNGCENTTTVNVAGDSSIPDLEVGGDTLSCDDPDGQLSVDVDNPIGSYEWEGPGGFNSSVPNPTVSDTGMYILTFTNQNGCVATDTAFVVGATEPPILSLNSDTLNCLQDTLNLTALPTPDGLDFSWSGPDSFSSTDPEPEVTEPGLYYVTVSSGGSCISSDSVLIESDTLTPSLTLQGDTMTCTNNGEVEIIATHNAGNAVFNWSGPSGVPNVDTLLQVNISGSYSLEIVPPNGCAVIDTIEILEDLVDPDIFVFDDTLNCRDPLVPLIVSSSSEIIFYKWDGPDMFISADSMPVVDEPGDYVVTITAENGCAATDTITVSIDFDDPVFSPQGDTLGCTDGSVQLLSNISTPFDTVQWAGPGNFFSNQPDPVVSQAGWYTVEVIGPNGCSVADSVEVVEDGDIPDLSISADTITCNDDIANLSAISQTPGVIYSWTGPGGFNSNLSDVDVNEAGTYNISIEAPNGCTASADVLVEVDTMAPQITLQADTITCIQSEVILNTNVSGNLFSVNWTGPNGFVSSDLEPLVSSAGIYTLEVEGDNGCIADAQLEVFQDADVPTIQATGGVLNCIDSLIILNAGSSVAGSSFTWNGPGGFVDSGPDVEVTEPGMYTIEVLTPSGCVAEEQVMVFDSTQTPVVTLIGENIPCDGSPAQLQAVIDPLQAQVNWTGPMNFVSGDTDISVTVPGQYFLEAIIPTTGCTVTESIAVEQDSLTITQLSIDVMDPDCGLANGFIDIFDVSGGQSPLTYGLQNDSITQSTGLFQDLGPGEYVLSVTDASGCAFLDTVELFGSNANFFVRLPDTIVINEGESVTLTPSTDLATSDISLIVWSPGTGLDCTDCLNPVSAPLQNTQYMLTLYDQGGCAQTDGVWIILRDTELPETDATIYVPNAFSPGNQDGINDWFNVFAAPEEIEEVEVMRIFNRWGDEMYEGQNFPASDPSRGWDGTFRGQMMNPDVYVYWIRVRMSDGSLKELSGDISIIN